MFEPILAQSLTPDLGIGERANEAIRSLVSTLSWLFNAIRAVVGETVDFVESALHWPPVWVVILIAVAIAAIATRRVGFPIFTAVAFLLVDAMGRFGEMLDTLALVLAATVLAVAIGIPIGIMAARSRLVSTLVRPALDFMQTMPSFIYLLLAVIFFGVGAVPGVMSSLIFSMPPAVRLTELGIRQVDQEVVEAAEAFGARPRSVLTEVQLPLARASIMTGVNQVIMLSLSMVVIAGLGGAGGLGATVVRSVTSVNVALGVEGGLSVVFLAIFLDRATAGFGAERRPGDNA